MAKRLVAVLVALAVVAPRPASAQGGLVVVEGRVTNGTAGGSVPEGLPVLVLQLDDEFDEVARREVATGPGGAFRTEGWDPAAGRRFAAGVEYLGVGYRGSVEGDTGTLPLDITVFETTSDETVLRTELDLLTVFNRSDGVMEALHSVRMVNGVDRTFVGDTSSQPPLAVKLPVPAGAYDLAPQEGVTNLVKFEGGVATGDPLPPGRTTLSFLYRVRTPASGWAVNRPVWYPTDKATLLVPSGLTFDAPGFDYVGTVPLDDRTYGRWDRSPGESDAPIPPGVSLSGRIGPDEAGSGLAVGLAVGLGGLVLLLGAFGLLRRRRRSRHGVPTEPAAVAAVGERTRLVEEIAALDDALEAGSVSRDEHAQRRGVLKQRLVDLTGEG